MDAYRGEQRGLLGNLRAVGNARRDLVFGLRQKEFWKSRARTSGPRETTRSLQRRFSVALTQVRVRRVRRESACGRIYIRSGQESAGLAQHFRDPACRSSDGGACLRRGFQKHEAKSLELARQGLRAQRVAYRAPVQALEVGFRQPAGFDYRQFEPLALLEYRSGIVSILADASDHVHRMSQSIEIASSRKGAQRLHLAFSRFDAAHATHDFRVVRQRRQRFVSEHTNNGCKPTRVDAEMSDDPSPRSTEPTFEDSSGRVRIEHDRIGLKDTPFARYRTRLSAAETSTLRYREPLLDKHAYGGVGAGRAQ